MPDTDWRTILDAIEELPSGLPTEHAALMARWFSRQFGGSPPPKSTPPSPASPADSQGLSALSFIEVRQRMEALGTSRQLRAHEKALLCSWVWSLSGTKEFCSNDAQKLYGDRGGNLTAHHFNHHATENEQANLARTGKGRYRFTERGCAEAERLAIQFLFPSRESDPASSPTA